MTNKGMLPEILVREMRDAFKRSEEFLDLETSNEDPILGHKEAMQQTIRDATPEELGSMLEVFQRMNIGNMGGGGKTDCCHIRSHKADDIARMGVYRNPS